MWGVIRGAIFIGGVLLGASALSGCSRRREEEPQRTPAPLRPLPSPRTAPSSSSPPSSSGILPAGTGDPPPVFAPNPSLPRPDCSRFTNTTDLFTIRNPVFELQELELAIRTIENHADDLTSRSFSNLWRDEEIRNHLRNLQGRDFYLFEGAASLLDTESDLMNLYAVRDQLNQMKDMPTYWPSDPLASQIKAAWDNGRLVVGVRRFVFRDDEVSHYGTGASAAAPGGPSINRYRVITSTNFRQYPIMEACFRGSDFIQWAARD